MCVCVSRRVHVCICYVQVLLAHKLETEGVYVCVRVRACVYPYACVRVRALVIACSILTSSPVCLSVCVCVRRGGPVIRTVCGAHEQRNE